MRMRTPVLTLVAVLGLGLLSAPSSLQTIKKATDDITGPYDVVANWPQIPRDAGFMQGSQAGCFAETPNRIFIVERGELKPPLGQAPWQKIAQQLERLMGRVQPGPSQRRK